MIDIINIGMDIGLLGILLASAVLILRSGNLLAITLLSTVYSLSICALFVIMDAVDVAFTEAAVGAGIFTVLILAVIKHKDESLAPRWPSAISIVLGLGLGALLIVGTLDMSMYGNPLAPVHLHLAPRFLGQSGTETGIPNVVTSVLASYRGYDTLGEVVVIFTAGLAVLLLLSPATTGTGRQLENQQNQSWLPATNPILKTALLRVIPLVLLFALYVQFHGDYGPGGGFQAGVIFGAGFITYGLLCGSKRLLAVLSERWITIGMAAGMLIYAGTGLAAMWRGGNFLDYSALAETPTAGQHVGILLIELGVGVTVAFTMISLFICFSRNQD